MPFLLSVGTVLRLAGGCVPENGAQVYHPAEAMSTDCSDEDPRAGVESDRNMW